VPYLRKFQSADGQQVLALHERALLATRAFTKHGSWDKDLENIDEVYVRPGGCFYVVEENGAIIGMGALKRHENGEAEIKRMRSKAYFREPERQRRCHLHVRQQGLQNQRYALLFRDFLRANKNVRIAYERIKRRLVEIFPESIDGYLYIKDPLMDIIYEGAESWASTVDWTPDASYL